MQIVNLEKDVTTATTEERLSATDLEVVSAVIQAKKANTGEIYLGGSSIGSANLGLSLAAGESFTLPQSALSKDIRYFNLKDFWIDAEVSGEGVSIVYFLRTT